MDNRPDIICIGSVLWDVIGRARREMRQGSDVPGRIVQLPGGVAMNIAMTLRRFDLHPALLSVVGTDAEGAQLVAATQDMGLDTRSLFRSPDLPTDRYMAIEGANGLIAAIADAHSLEAAGDAILAPLRDGRLGSAAAPYEGMIALDGNLTTQLLAQIAVDPCFAAADLRVAPASPGKAERLLPFVAAGRATLYVNLEEAQLLCGAQFSTSVEAVTDLLARGAQRVLVTDGGGLAAEGDGRGIRRAVPPEVTALRITGAGDTFMAAHMSAERRGLEPSAALDFALDAAARYVSGETKL
jgi:pseudouridine kinase